MMQSPMHGHVFSYWGKADPNYPGESKWHPLAYHSLDVAAVAATWWDTCPPLQGNFSAAFACETSQAQQLRAWVLFFVALHDLGKFDLRFQLKALDAVAAAWRPFEKEDHGLSPKAVAEFDHGHAGIAWAKQEYQAWLRPSNVESGVWEHWQPWLAAVTGSCPLARPPLEGELEAEDALAALAKTAPAGGLVYSEAQPSGQPMRLRDVPLHGRKRQFGTRLVYLHKEPTCS